MRDFSEAKPTGRRVRIVASWQLGRERLTLVEERNPFMPRIGLPPCGGGRKPAIVLGTVFALIVTLAIIDATEDDGSPIPPDPTERATPDLRPSDDRYPL